MSLFVFTVVLVCVEAGLFLVVKLQRRGFPWLITSNDGVSCDGCSSAAKVFTQQF